MKVAHVRGEVFFPMPKNIHQIFILPCNSPAFRQAKTVARH
jgi:hypothetical protein